jgi:DNA-binding transcriptional regulator YiaG
MISCRRYHGTGLIQSPQEIARQLRALRTRAGVSQGELARRLKITGASISQVESGRRPPYGRDSFRSDSQ